MLISQQIINGFKNKVKDFARRKLAGNIFLKIGSNINCKLNKTTFMLFRRFRLPFSGLTVGSVAKFQEKEKISHNLKYQQKEDIRHIEL
jgi:hypothetical protein